MRLNLTLATIATLAAGSGALAQTLPAPRLEPFACPRTQTLDCMPIVPPERRAFCGKDYLDWAARHCPGLRVVY